MTPEHERLLAKVADLYHVRGWRQQRIADELHLSQARVSRLLAQAAERGIVKSIVVPPPGVHPEVEEALRKRFGLIDAVVVDAGEDDTTNALGVAAAAYLESTLQSKDVLGISSWSSSLLATASVMTTRPTGRAAAVVQMFGGVGNADAQVQATRLLERFASVTGARPIPVPAPGVVGNADLQRALMADPELTSVSDQWARITTSVVGIGSLEPSALLASSGNAVSPAEQAELASRGVVGDVCLRFFDARGVFVESSFDHRVVGMSADAILAVPRRIGVAGGSTKVSAIASACAGHWISVLVTDRPTAEAVLTLTEEGASGTM